MKKISAVLAVLMLFALLSTGAFAAKTGGELVSEWVGEIGRITPMELAMEMDFGEEFLILDIRPESAFAAGRIPGSIHLDFGISFFRIANYVPDPDAYFIISCQSGARSVILVKLLQDMGYTNVVDIEGGFNAWFNSGYQVETDAGIMVKY